MALKVKKRSGKRLSPKEKAIIEGCIAPGEKNCPAVSKLDAPYQYQRGCRAGACRTANRNYYKDWRDKRAAKVVRDKRKKAAARKAREATKKTTKRVR